jgi:invasion protein IalB
MMDLMRQITRRLVVLTATGACTLVGMGVGAALAQTNAQPVRPALAPKPDGVPAVANDSVLDDWVKICNTDPQAKKEICQTTYDLRAPSGQFLANFTLIEASGETRKIVRLIVPTGLLLQEDLQMKVDESKPEAAKYAYCAPDACVAQIVGSDAFMAAMKKGRMLTVNAVNQTAQPVTFQFPLAGFVASNSGKPLDRAALQKRAESIKQEIQQSQMSLEEQLKAAQQKAQQAQP